MERRPIHIEQREHPLRPGWTGQFWYVIKGGNGEPTATSKTYTERWRANRAARNFIDAISPAPVTYTHFVQRGNTIEQVTERFNQ